MSSVIQKNVIGILLLSTLLISSGFFWQGITTELGGSYTDVGLFNKSNILTSQISSYKQETDNIVEADLGGIFRAVNNVINTVKLILGSAGIFTDYISQLGTEIGLPSFISIFIISIVIILSLFAYINFVSGRSKI
jgi:hypothetical protein